MQGCYYMCSILYLIYVYIYIYKMQNKKYNPFMHCFLIYFLHFRKTTQYISYIVILIIKYVVIPL